MMDLALTGDHGECMASRKRVTLQRQNFGSTCGELRKRNTRSVELRFHSGLAPILILLRELATQKAPDINAFRGAIEHRFEVMHVICALPRLVWVWSSVLNDR